MYVQNNVRTNWGKHRFIYYHVAYELGQFGYIRVNKSLLLFETYFKNIYV